MIPIEDIARKLSSAEHVWLSRGAAAYIDETHGVTILFVHIYRHGYFVRDGRGRLKTGNGTGLLRAHELWKLLITVFVFLMTPSFVLLPSWFVFFIRLNDPKSGLPTYSKNWAQGISVRLT
jgi:hypothetical protein